MLRTEAAAHAAANSCSRCCRWCCYCCCCWKRLSPHAAAPRGPAHQPAPPPWPPPPPPPPPAPAGPWQGPQQRRRKQTFPRPAPLPPPQADRRGPSQSANLGPCRCVCEDPWPRLQGSRGHGTATNRSPRCPSSGVSRMSVRRCRSAVFALAANHRLAAVAAHGPGHRPPCPPPSPRQTNGCNRKNTKTKRALGWLQYCNILDGQRRRNHHRPENKVQSGNDYIYLVLTPKIIIFLITHFEKRGLLIIRWRYPHPNG